MPLVIIYSRFSIPTQAKGHSSERQKSDAERYAERHGWTIDESRSFADRGMSAFRSRHAKEGAFAGFLAAVKAGAIRAGTILIVEHLDRLSRDKVRIARDQFEALLDAGVEIVTTSPERHYTRDDLDDVVGLIEPLLLMARAHEESEKKSDRLKKRFASDRVKWADTKQTRGAKVPAWLVLRDGKYVAIPSAAAAVREVFRMSVADGGGAYQIAGAMNRSAFKAIGKSGKWNTTYINNILRNRAVLGECQPHRMVDGKRVPTGNPIPGYYPRIVSDETYYRAQGARTTRTTARGRAGVGTPNLFTGIIFDRDGGSMQSWTKSKGNRSRYLTSSSARSRREGPFISFPYELLERTILTQVSEMTAADLNGERAARVAAVEGMETELKDLVGRIERIKARAVEVDDEDDDVVDLLRRLNTNRKAMADRLEKARAEASGTVDHLADCQTLIEAMDAGDDCRRQVKAMLPRIIDRITVVLTRTEARAVLAVVTVRWARGDSSTVTLHSRKDLVGARGRTGRVMATILDNLAPGQCVDVEVEGEDDGTQDTVIVARKK